MSTDSGRTFFAVGAVSAGIGVVAGAFGAHGLKDVLSAEMLDVFETAVRYQMYHAFGLMAVAWAAHNFASTGSPLARLAGMCFVFGTVVFSGSLYAMSLTNLRWLGALTPLGGIAFIAGWFFLAASVWKKT
ncbi:MAG: DUF423 domain-containing protein [Ignavibacteriae bacterium]|nr:DUF423 domain-containing protein [Ignavibacteriota bacterium]